ncbi:MAG: shikimate dehydrogenase [Caldithrix sp.]|nr:shikimate dehydrogenase [Caldithrix sp.]
MPDLYGIIGYPLKHSFSPEMHTLAFARFNMDAVYEAYEIEPSAFQQRIAALKSEPYKGFNVTVPYKQAIIPYLDDLQVTARKIGAVNTIVQTDDGGWRGYNTDYAGFLAPIRERLSQINSVLIIGAGGAARAVVFGLLQRRSYERVVLVNRSKDRAGQLAEEVYREEAKNIEVHGLSEITQRPDAFDLVVNTTSVGMHGHEGQIPLDAVPLSHATTIVYDLIYNPAKTAFLQRAEQAGLTILNGLPMLIGQAAESFYLWRRKRWPQTLVNDMRKRLLRT